MVKHTGSDGGHDQQPVDRDARTTVYGETGRMTHREHAAESRRLAHLANPNETSPEYHELVMREAQWHATMAVYEALRSQP
jgi:hypothetical protein